VIAIKLSYNGLSLILLLIITAALLGGCQRMNETEKEALFAEAESHAIPYLKEKFDLS
jgi:hypothetical protein